MNQKPHEIAPEYAAAFSSAQTAKNICLFAIFVALGLQLASMFMIRFVGVLDPLEGHRVKSSTTIGLPRTPATIPTTSPATAPTSAPIVVTAKRTTVEAPTLSESAIGRAVMWRESLTWAMDATKALAPIICVLLVLALLLAVMLSLVGRLGGMAGLTSALFWSLVLLILLTPWQHIFQGRFACGAMYSLHELIDQTRTIEPAWGAQDPSLLTRSTYYVRFVGLPALAVLVWIIVLVKFAIGRFHMVLPAPITSIPIPVPAPMPGERQAADPAGDEAD